MEVKTVIKHATTVTLTAIAAVGLIVGGTFAYWFDSAKVADAQITNGNLEIVEIGDLEVTPGDINPPSGTTTKQTVCKEGWKQATKTLTNNVILGSGDQAVSVRFPIKIVTVGDNLVAKLKVGGSIKTRGDTTRFTTSPIRLVDGQGKEVTQVRTGTYYAQMTVHRNGATAVSETATDSLTIEKMTATLSQVR